MTPDKEKAAGGNHAAEENAQHHITKPHLFRQDIIESFRQALDKAGLSTKEKFTADGKLRRFTVYDDRPGSKNGWYILYGDGLPAGAFGCWKRQIHDTWCAKSDRQLTAAERAEFSRRMNEARIVREAEEQARRTKARNEAQTIWQTAPPAPNKHPYLVKKRVGNHGLRLHNGTLAIPLRDSDGVLHSLQFIDGEGNKRFLAGGRKKGCYFVIGSPTESLCIAEGYATAASVHESTGLPVAVAFDAGNLLPVATALRARFPAVKIIVCADDDANTPGNPGLTKARVAAEAIGGLLAVARGASW